MRLNFVVAIVLVFFSVAARADVLVIAHPSVQERDLNTETLSRLFLKKLTRWPKSDTAVVVFDGKPDSPQRSLINDRVHQRSGAAVAAYWQQHVFAGRGVPPVVIESDSAMLSRVASTPGAIGYVADDVKPIGVVVIAVIHGPRAG